MLNFDKNTGFLTLPHPENPKRNLKFRIKSGYLDTADEPGILWEPRRLAKPEEIAVYEALCNMLATCSEGVTEEIP